jgi:formylglycine-generating enzyme required for sulfatase activity
LPRLAVHCFLVLCALAPLAQSQDPAPKRKALVIGNAKYAALTRPPAAAADAAQVKSALEELSFRVTVAADLDFAAMRSTMRAFTSSIVAGDEVFVYFCGVGMHIDGDNFLLPVDFDPVKAGPRYSLTLVLQDLDDRKAANKTIFVDAARAHKALGESAGLIIPIEQTAETVMVFSHQFEQVFADDAAASPSVFAKALASALRKPGLSVSGIGEQVLVETANLTRGRQQPVIAMQRLSASAIYRPAPKPLVIEKVIERPTVIVKQAELEPGAVRDVKQAGMPYSWIPPGEFQMGCVPNDKDCKPQESPRHKVTISKGFWITKTEVTARSYQDFARATNAPMPKATNTNKDWLLRANPVTKVSWDSAQKYCEWLGGRLPSEAEWEYAARAGKDGSIFPWGDVAGDHDQANMFGKAKSKTSRDQWDEYTSAPVGSFDANAWGLYDVSGNVREWVLDWYDPAYYQANAQGAVDPMGPSASPVKKRVTRGGDYYSKVTALRLSDREFTDQEDNRTGFRCMLPVLPSN